MVHERTTRRIAAALLVVFLVGVAGVIPLPASWFTPLSDPDAYPCAGHACGCRSIDDCFSGCGCQSEADLLAWLDRTGKDAPAWWSPSSPQLAGKSSPTETCPLCHSDDDASTIPTPRSSCTVDPSPDGLGSGVTTISALSCRGLPIVYLLAAPMFLAGQAAIDGLMAPQQIGLITIEASCPGPEFAREIPTPPPRPVV